MLQCVAINAPRYGDAGSHIWHGILIPGYMSSILAIIACAKYFINVCCFMTYLSTTQKSASVALIFSSSCASGMIYTDSDKIIFHYISLI
jgi:hypothetical protein